MKQWFRGEFNSNRSDKDRKDPIAELVNFSNRNRLASGDLVVILGHSDRDYTQVTFMYYAGRKLV